MKELDYPFDSGLILKKARHLKKELLAEKCDRIEKRIAVLGGSTTHDVVRILELFLLQQGIRPVFYESEYHQYREDALFPDDTLKDFHPDIVYLHTSSCNITRFPEIRDDEAKVRALLEEEFARFEEIWNALKETHHAVIIQNNFELPSFRLLGNSDATDMHGRVSFIGELNRMFALYARSHEGFYVHDIHYLSARYGLDAWSDPAAWYLYKYILALPAIPDFAHNLANIMKAIFGKNKKALVLDLDNTLWGGVIGDDGEEGIEIGRESATAEAYTAFQEYLKSLQGTGVLLNIASKNTEENALKGLAHPDSVLKEDDFLFIRANWEPKSDNVAQIAADMNILPESLVFVDDNPAERDIVEKYLPGIGVPVMEAPERYIQAIDRNGFFEVTALSADDLKRGDMYRDNLKRRKLSERFTDYHAYLLSLEMEAEIAPFAPVYYERIAQLTNKSNQFNLTTKRYTVEEIKEASLDPEQVTLYGRLKDKFGDNGVVSLVIAKLEKEKAHIILWLMSCRVLKRDMEFAMMDALIPLLKERGVTEVYGYYDPTAKNGMVKDFYALQGFTKISGDETGAAVWRLDSSGDYAPKTDVIRTGAKTAL